MSKTKNNHARVSCSVCEESFRSMDHFVDHVTDEHEFFDGIVNSIVEHHS